MGLVSLVSLVTKGGGLFIQTEGQILRPEFLQYPEEHPRKDENGLGGKPPGSGKELLYGIMGPVDKGSPVDEINYRALTGLR